MKRKAVLIESSNVQGEKEIPGARADITNWVKFLKSDLGGLWLESEIAILRKPFTSDVKNELAGDYDYTFVAFSGHGSDGNVALNDVYKTCPLQTLYPTSKKGTLIIDACRGIEPSATGQAFANSANWKSATFSAVQARSLNEVLASEQPLNRVIRSATARSLWEADLNLRNNGMVRMYACSSGEGANEDPFAGGFYTSLLISSAEAFLKSGTSAKIHTTKNAHDYAAYHMPPQQNPEYEPGDLAFPFAVNP